MPDLTVASADPPAATNRAALLCLFVGLVAVVVGVGLLHGRAADRTLFASINAWATDWPELWSALSVFGLGLGMLLIVASAGPRHAHEFAQALLIVVVGGLFVRLLKLTFASPRPLAVLGEGGLHVVGIELQARSMPSGHAATAFALAALVMLAPGRRGPHLVLSALALVFAVGVGLARIGVGAHWPSDVCAGAGVGVVAGAVVALSAPLRRFVDAFAAAMLRGAGPHLTAAAIVVLAASAWVADRDYPLAGWAHGALALIGLLGAARWWRGASRQEAI
jgi:membrane-associated phospholipid phosphatase